MKTPGIRITYRIRDEIPEPALKVAEKRMDSFVRGYGQTIMGGAPISLQAFALSCYIQGCEDMAQVAIREIPSATDFQI